MNFTFEKKVQKYFLKMKVKKMLKKTLKDKSIKNMKLKYFKTIK